MSVKADVPTSQPGNKSGRCLPLTFRKDYGRHRLHHTSETHSISHSWYYLNKNIQLSSASPSFLHRTCIAGEVWLVTIRRMIPYFFRARHKYRHTQIEENQLTSSKVKDQLPFSTIGTKTIEKKKGISSEIAHLLIHLGNSSNRNRHLLIIRCLSGMSHSEVLSATANIQWKSILEAASGQVSTQKTQAWKLLPSHSPICSLHDLWKWKCRVWKY